MSLSENASRLIRNHLGNNKDASIAGLARSCGLPVSTVRAIAYGEISNPSIDRVAEILYTFLPFEEVLAFVQEHSQDGKFWTGVLERCATSQATNVPSTEAFEWVHPDQEIAALAGGANGITRTRIQSLYGKGGEQRLDALLSAGVLREINGAIKQVSDFVRYSLKDSQKKAALQTSQWGEADMVEGGFLYHITQTVSDVGHERAKALTRAYLQELMDLDKQHPGSNVLMFSVVANSLGGASK